jgi:protein-tyrosine phosphatase
MNGRIDVHSHLLPGVDDGCESLAESLECARRMASAGYSHIFCTPHVWPSNPHVTIDAILGWTQRLQESLDANGIVLRLMPGGEINLNAHALQMPAPAIPTYAMARKHVLIDMWADKLPPLFEEGVRRYQELGLAVVLGHPERMRAIQDDPPIIERIQAMGVLLQGNLHCLSDSPDSATFETVTRFLEEDRYFLLGSDLHKLASLPARILGLGRAIDMFGVELVDRLTITNPRTLLPGESSDD